MTAKGALEIAVLATLLSCGFAQTRPHARAQDSELQSSDYKGIIDAAVEEYSLGHWDEALALFTKAHELKPNARTFWGMGNAAFEARRYAEALRFSQAACDDPRKPLTGAQRTRAESVVKRAGDFLAKVHLEITPASAVVSVDGAPVERDARGLALFGTGQHQLVVSAEGYLETVRTVQWSPGSTAKLQLKLSRIVDTKTGQLTPHDAWRHRALSIGKWTALGAAVAALATTGVGLALRQAAVERWNDELKCPAPKSGSCPDQRDKANSWRSANIATGASAAALAGLAATLFLVDRPGSRALSHALTTCQPATGKLGLACQLHF